MNATTMTVVTPTAREPELQVQNGQRTLQTWALPIDEAFLEEFPRTSSEPTGTRSSGQSFQVTTGRRLAETLAREPRSHNVIVMRDGDCAFATAADPDDEIYWGAYLGMPAEILISGKVRDVSAKIREARADARARRGWIMDTYPLRRRRQVHRTAAKGKGPINS
ncbi:MAG TPA: hypothetical protein VMA54_09980 [Steroidobacteraceae bacterium]|nr:hypothetical protein [Steroidobacteraceae bacterium]